MKTSLRGVAAVVLFTALACTDDSGKSPWNVTGPAGRTPPTLRVAPPGLNPSLAPPVVVQTRSTEWSEYATGAQPTGWSQQWDATSFFQVAAEPSVTSGKVLQWSGSQTRNRWVLTYDAFGSPGDQEVLTDFRVRTLGSGANIYYLGVAAVRVSGTGTDERGYATFLVHDPISGQRTFVLATWVNGGYYFELASVPMTWQLDTWYSVRLQAYGSSIRARIWPRGTTEPSAWTLNAADWNYSSGRMGVFHHDDGTVQWARWTGSILQDTSTAAPAGATAQTTFANYATGSQPTGWTETSAPASSSWTVVADATVADARVLRNVTTSTGRHMLRYDAVPDTTTVQEALVRMRMADDDGRGPGIALRHSMDASGRESAYVAYFRSSIDQLEVNAFVNGGWQFIGSVGFVNNPGVWYWMRFRAEGVGLRVKVWADGTAEPAAWTFNGSNSALATGSVGLYVYEPNTVDYDVFSVATGGPTAPTPTQGPPPPPPTLVSVSVSPSTPSVQTGATVQFSASGSMSDGSTTTPAVNWTATGGTITAGGLYTAGSTAGTYQVTATEPGSGKTGTTTVTVTAPPTLVSVSVTPSPASVQAGATVQFSASGTMSNGSTTTPTVNWTATGGTITAGGLYTAGSTPGTYQVTATEPGTGTTGTATVTVTAPPPPPTLVSVSVTPSPATVQVGTTVQLQARGTMSNGATTTPTVNWTATGGTISATGLYTAGPTPGTYQATATEPGSGISGTATINVTAAPPPPPAGTTWQTTFTGYTTGAQPSGWTETAYPNSSAWTVAADASSASGFVLRNVTTQTGRHILRYDGFADTTTTQEALVRMRLTDDDDRGPGIALRHSMLNGSETAYVAYLRSSVDQIELNAFVNGGWQFIGSAGFVNNPGVWYWMRFRVEGTTLRVRVWADGTTEPTTWNVTATNSSIAAGAIGLYTYEPNTVDYSFFSIATSGFTAPKP